MTETHSVGLSGKAISNRLNWRLYQKYNDSESYGVSGYANMRGSMGSMGLGIASNKNSLLYNANANGSVLLSKHGFLLGQEILQSSAILIVPESSGVSISNNDFIKTNSHGKALFSGILPYRVNHVSIDPLTLPDNVDINQTDITLIPTAGAIVEGWFDAKVGNKAYVKIKTSAGDVPFGAVVSIRNSNMVAGIVGTNGNVFLTGLPDNGVLEVKWGREDEKICKADFDIEHFNSEHDVICEI